MPRFVYTARDTEGRPLQGTLEADSQGTVALRLRAQGYVVTGIKPAPAARTGRTLVRPVRPASPRSLAIFCQQFATLQQAGVPVTGALRICAGQAETAAWREALNRIRLQVEKGESLAGAFRQAGRFFPTLVGSLVEAGELSGTLDESFARLAEHFEREHELRQKVGGALLYPAIIICVAVVVVTLLLAFVLPGFLETFQGLGLEMPLPARILLGVGHVARAQGLWILVALAGAGLGVSSWFRTPVGRKWRDLQVLRLPLFGRLVQSLEVARTARTLATMLHSGIPALSALKMTSEVVGNVRFREALAQAAEAVRSGVSLTLALDQTKAFPALVVQIVEVGESTGTVDSMLNHVADFYEREAENKIKALTTALEPAIIIVVGLIVGFIVASIMLPMFDMMGGLSG
ncbi:MAG TPA: type II secretion system F family protein [Firmicutes bacterium]|nr:type II secretion system F family protein [Bacillota bacterium]